jgi:prepilin-type processing-associated H-X9-DG protein
MAVNDEFGIYDGGGWQWGHTDYGVNPQVIHGRPICAAITSITDGTSQTILVGEEALSPLLYDSGSWFYNEPFFFGNAPGNRRFGSRIVRDAMDLSFRENWGSAHPAGAHFAFADGSVRSLSYSTSPGIVSALLTPAGGEAVGDF